MFTRWQDTYLKKVRSHFEDLLISVQLVKTVKFVCIANVLNYGSIK